MLPLTDIFLFLSSSCFSRVSTCLLRLVFSMRFLSLHIFWYFLNLSCVFVNSSSRFFKLSLALSADSFCFFNLSRTTRSSSLCFFMNEGSSASWLSIRLSSRSCNLAAFLRSLLSWVSASMCCCNSKMTLCSALALFRLADNTRFTMTLRSSLNWPFPPALIRSTLLTRPFPVNKRKQNWNLERSCNKCLQLEQETYNCVTSSFSW